MGCCFPRFLYKVHSYQYSIRKKNLEEKIWECYNKIVILVTVNSN